MSDVTHHSWRVHFHLLPEYRAAPMNITKVHHQKQIHLQLVKSRVPCKNARFWIEYVYPAIKSGIVPDQLM